MIEANSSAMLSRLCYLFPVKARFASFEYGLLFGQIIFKNWTRQRGKIEKKYEVIDLYFYLLENDSGIAETNTAAYRQY